MARFLSFALTAIMVGFGHGFGGGRRRIEDPDKKNKLTQVDKKK